MGLFKNIKAQVQAATEMAAEIRASAPPVAGAPATMGGPPAPPGITILNPTPQDEVDRLLDAGGEARGVLLGSRHDMSNGERPMRTRVHVRVRPRLRGGALGDEVALKAWVSWKVATLLDPGLEIPIELDRATGRPTGISTGHLNDELSPRFEEAKRRRKGWDLDTGLEGITQSPGMLKETFGRGSAPPPTSELPSTDPLLAPIGGVTWEQFIAVRAEITTRPSPDGFDAVAQRYCVPPGAWAGIDAAWMQRIMGAPSLAQQLGTDLDAAQRALRGR